MNTVVNKRAVYIKNMVSYVRIGMIRQKNDFYSAISLSAKVCQCKIKKNKTTWPDYRNKTEQMYSQHLEI